MSYSVFRLEFVILISNQFDFANLILIRIKDAFILFFKKSNYEIKILYIVKKVKN